MKSRYLLSTTLSCALLMPALVHAKPPASESDRQKAVEHFRLGNEAFANGDSLQAYTEYTAAWSLHETFDIACNLGRTEAELGKARDAAEHLAFCLANFSASARPEIRSAEGKLREVFAEVSARVSSLTLRVEPDGAIVRIDGAIVGKTPLRKILFLEPGEHQVDVRMAGYDSVQRVVSAAKGEQQELMLDLSPQSAARASEASPSAHAEAPTQAPPPAGPSDDGGVEPRTIALLTGGGLATIGLAVGGGFWFRSRQLDDDARKARRAAVDTLGQGGCRFDPEAAECVRLARAIDDRDSARTVSTVGLVAGGAFAMGTLATYLWWPRTNSGDTALGDQARNLAWSPVVTSHEIGLSLSGSL